MRDIGPVSPSPPEGLVDALHRAQRPLLLTGAGMSAESGIATFRGGEDSLWSRFDPMRLATPEAFDADPPLVWAWYRWRMAKIAQAQPHPGHRALAALAELKPGLVLATHWQRHFDSQLSAQVMVDIVVVCSLMLQAGGVGSGRGSELRGRASACSWMRSAMAMHPPFSWRHCTFPTT